MTSNDNLYALIEAALLRKPEACAFELAGGAIITRGELDRQVSQMAGALRDLGVRPGDRVSAQVEKSLTNVALYLATAKIGAVYNPLNTAYTTGELDYFISNAEPTLVVVAQVAADAVRTIAARHGSAKVETLEADGSGSLRELQARAEPLRETAVRDADDLAALLYTSGTTGRSKGAMITHANLTSNALTLLEVWAFQPDDVLLHALPIFHVHGLFVALNTALLNGSPILWHAKFDADAVIADLARATVIMGVPTFYTRFLTHPGLTPAACANMRLFIAGSAPLLAETHNEFAARTGHHILERYGMTEAGMITSNPYHGERLAGTVGYALPGVSVRIADEHGQEVPRGEVGVLDVKGPNVFKGYWGMPEKTAEEFRPDGYFISGDVATMAKDGRIAIVGRAKDMIISGGFNVYPVEIEDELNQLDGIGESAVIGVPHPDFGEGVVAVVTAIAGQAVPSEAKVASLLEGRLARFKQPKRLYVVDELPRNSMGKVQKAELRARYKDSFRTG